MVDYRNEFKQLLENTFISAKGSKIDIYNGMVSFLNKVIPNIPEHLFRYRKIDKYTVGALESGTISVCKAKCFSDKYDSLVFVDAERELSKSRDASMLALQRVLKGIKNKDPQIRSDRASRLCYYIEQGMSDEQIIEKLFEEQIGKDLNEQSKELKHRESRFRDSERTEDDLLLFRDRMIQSIMPVVSTYHLDLFKLPDCFGNIHVRGLCPKAKHGLLQEIIDTITHNQRDEFNKDLCG